MTVVIAYGTASVGKSLLVTLLEQYRKLDLAFTSRDARQAIEGIRRERPHLVIVEDRLLEGSGFDVVEHIRRDTDVLAVVMVSTKPWETLLPNWRQYGIDLVLRMPDHEDQLRKTLEQMGDGDPIRAIMRWRNRLGLRRGSPSTFDDDLKTE
jgi:DNA-binding NarL/FixJ family response regulator